jgi:hypothetical protein
MANVKNAFTDQGTLSGAVGGLAESLINSAVGSASPLNNYARYMTGARAIIKVNGKLFGFAFGVNYNIATPHDEVWTIDDWTPYELAPQRVSISGTMGLFHIPGKGPTAELVQANVLSFLMHKYITIEITDQTTGQKIFKTERAVITNKNQILQAGDISTIQLSWKAIGWLDELTPSYPQGADGEAGGGAGGLLDSISNNLFG